MTKHLIGLAAVSALVAAAPAAGAARTVDCHTKDHLRAHGLSCAAAKQAQRTEAGFSCRSIGHATHPPFTLQCTKKHKRHVSFTFQVNGG